MAFVPSDLSGIIAHWRGEDIPSGTPDPLNWDDVVSGWRLSATGTARPTYSASAIGGLPGLSFDGSTDFLTTTTTKSLTNNIQVAIVCNLTSQGTGRGLVSIGPSATPNWQTALMAVDPYSTVANYIYFDGHYEAYRPVIPAATNMVTRLATCEQTSGGFWVNGVRGRGYTGSKNEAVSLITKTSYLHLGVGSGTGQKFLGPICEAVVWTEPVVGSHFAWVEGYLAHKYAITLPTWHPFYAAAPTSGPSSGGNTLAALRHGIHLGNRGVK